ncbi:MAG TPA: cysteine desulfurase family protein [Polyangia bacterium]|nr:cysteine desulfurase family protein [Polyangia bacterium]
MRPVVYLDNGATTRVDERVALLAAEAMTVAFGNPSSAHRLGVEAARRLDEARQRVARAIGAAATELTFTSGGTESNALGFYGAARAARGKHVVCSAFEHPSVLDAAARLKALGYEVSLVAPEPSGAVDVARFAEAVRADTAACALMLVQNEIGIVQPVAEVARAVKAKAPRCHVHVDAVQAIGKLAVDVTAQPIDSLALSAHKLHGPKGAGALWLRKGARVEPRQFGGGQERGVRPGTEGVPGLVALGLAVELAERARPEAARRMAEQRDRLWALIAARVPGARRHGDPSRAAPHILSVGFPARPAEPLLHAMEARGVCVSAGSACHAKDKRPSATLRALGVPDDMGTLRFSLSRDTTDEEIGLAAEAAAAAFVELAT